MTKEEMIERLNANPFVPHPMLRNPHAQTIAGVLIPRRFTLLAGRTEARYFDVATGVRVLAQCSWQPDRTARPTLLVAHGMEGSAESRYMLGTAEKALAAGMNAVRVNFRNCGGTEHLTPTLYHAGLTDDLRQIIAELTERDGLNEIYVAGFSLGGNVVLKMAGEYGGQAPASLKAIIAVSPSIDLPACADAIEMRSNIIYHLRFVWSLKSRLRRKARLFPDKYDVSRLRGVWSIRKFDDRITAPYAGFRGVDHYYERASALPLIKEITVPTLIIHAEDDPFIPAAPLKTADVTSNPNVMLLVPASGGHVGFISATGEGQGRFWAEAQLVEFVRMMSEE